MIEIKHLSKTFQMKDGAVNALKDISLTIPDGSIYGIIGMSGAGKSTLVRCINLLERPTEGSVVIDGVEMEKLTPAQLRQRRREITMIFQQFNLLMQRSCLKNICFPMELAGVKKEEAEKRAKELGMRQPGSSQIIYVQVDADDTTEVYAAPAEKNVFVRVIDAFRSAFTDAINYFS